MRGDRRCPDVGAHRPGARSRLHSLEVTVNYKKEQPVSASADLPGTDERLDSRSVRDRAERDAIDRDHAERREDELRADSIRAWGIVRDLRAEVATLREQLAAHARHTDAARVESAGAMRAAAAGVCRSMVVGGCAWTRDQSVAGGALLSAADGIEALPLPEGQENRTP